MVEEFEARICEVLAIRDSVLGVNSGTDALRFALMAAGIEQGDVVVTVPHTFIATTEAISQAGGANRVRGHRRRHLCDGSGEASGIPGK